MNVIIYSNCHGHILKEMFETHEYTKYKFKINHIVNYENLDKQLDPSHKFMLENCDIFMYQPFNNKYSHSEYDISAVKEHLKTSCIILRINYYRFKGFWFESEHKPYNEYLDYIFNADSKYFGIHNSFINFNGNKQETIDKVNNINIDNDTFLKYFKRELDELKLIDDNSDVKMYEYFLNNYKDKSLFHDGFHPTNLFFYEIFRQIVLKLMNCELIVEDMDFIKKFDNIEWTHWSLPILPIVKTILDIKTPDITYVFYGHLKKAINVYDYYYIRLSHANFQNYLDNINQEILV